MIGDSDDSGNEDREEATDDQVEKEIEEEVVSDNVGDISVEINVRELVAKVESAHSDESRHDREIRKKLDKMRTEQKDDLDSTYNFNLDDEL